MKSVKKYICILALESCFLSGIQAQSIFDLSILNRSTQSMGMGALSNAMEVNAFSVFDNASKTAFTHRGLEVGGQYAPWAKNLTKEMERDNRLFQMGMYYSISDKHKLLLGVSNFSLGGDDLYLTDENGNVTTQEIKPMYTSIHAGYATRLFEYWGASAVLNYAQWNPDLGDRVHALSVDLGVTRRWNLQGQDLLDLSFRAAGWGAVVSGQDGYKLPGLLNLGAWYQKVIGEEHQLRGGLDFGYQCLGETAFRGGVGMEYAFHQSAFVRGGYQFCSEDNAQNGFATVGLGVRLFDTVQLDGAYLLAGSDSPLKNTFMVGFQVKL